MQIRTKQYIYSEYKAELKAFVSIHRVASLTTFTPEDLR